MMKPAFEHTAAAEQNAIATARRHLEADRNQQLIAKVFSKADEAEEGLTPRAYRERNAAVRLEARVKLAEEGERTALELRPVDDAAVVWVRALPADAAAAGLREILAGFGTVVGCALHPLAKWEEAEFEALRHRPKRRAPSVTCQTDRRLGFELRGLPHAKKRSAFLNLRSCIPGRDAWGS